MYRRTTSPSLVWGSAEGATGPDLVVRSPAVNDSRPSAGESFTLSATVRNQGNGQSAATTLRCFRSSDATISTGDTQVGTDSVDSLPASGRSDESVQLAAPSGVGTYYYGACVDPVSGESNTANNCSNGVAVTLAPGVAGADCYVGLLVRPGESCTYPGTRFEFSVDSSGRASFLHQTASDGTMAIFTGFAAIIATHQGDGVWRIGRVGSQMAARKCRSRRNLGNLRRSNHVKWTTPTPLGHWSTSDFSR